MRFYRVRNVKDPRYSGGHDYGHKWGLPGIHCPACNNTWSTTACDYPCVDLSGVPEPKLGKAYCENDYNEFARLVELVRPFVPEGAPLPPGAGFGPLTGRAHGKFGPIFVRYPWEMLVSPDTLRAFEDAGLRGLRACPTQFRSARKNTPQMLELNIDPYGSIYEEELPPEPPLPCPLCGLRNYKDNDEIILDLASLPPERDIFRPTNATNMIIVTQPFVDTVKQLELPDIAFQELAAR